jgi:RNA polymerase sigma-70 factor (ECF subfamily)
VLPLPLEARVADTSTVTLPVPDPAAPASDAFFDRQWAVTLVDRAVAALASEERGAGREASFGVLKPWLLGDIASLSQVESARQLGMSEGAMKVAVHRLRKRFREAVKAEIAGTLDGPTQVQEELRYLVEALAKAEVGS